jgi:hypothetical protein
MMNLYAMRGRRVASKRSGMLKGSIMNEVNASIRTHEQDRNRWIYLRVLS